MWSQPKTQKDKHPTVAGAPSRTQYQVVHAIQRVQCSLHTVGRSKSARFHGYGCEPAERRTAEAHLRAIFRRFFPRLPYNL